GDADAVVGAITQGGADLLAEPGKIDHDVPDSSPGQRLEVIDDERLAGNLDEWLRHGIGDRPQSLPAPGREQHGPPKPHSRQFGHADCAACRAMRSFARGSSGATRRSRNSERAASSGYR